MEEESLMSVLDRWNFWNREILQGKPRSYYVNKIFPFMERKEVLVLKGIRRCGKSTIMKQLMKKLIDDNVDKSNILYVNLDDLFFIDSLNTDLFKRIFDEYKNNLRPKGKIYFFIDEIQKVPKWESFIRTMYDLDNDIKFIVSGSNSSLLSKELSTLLTGRNISFTIRPLSYFEFKEFTNQNFVDYLEFGGFPEVVLEKDKEKKKVLLQQYLEDILSKDIIDRYNIRNTRNVLSLARNLIFNSGNKFSINKLSKIYGMSRDSISEYINYLIDAFILVEVPYFSFSIQSRHDVAKLPKLYVQDTGFLTISSLGYTKNKGRYYETAVLIKLLMDEKDLAYWSELKSEVDFVIENRSINVTATDNIHERELQGLMDFEKKHKRFRKILVTQSLKEDYFIPIEEFLLDYT
ncbi:hypothetical protein C0585_02080 [Candidatus Woesearchaeota archaeon]|nr:MAG: hypothetical protein C0585_02080 [Candidatus Woesearchaeota archaeon]